MQKTASARLSLRLEPELKSWIEEEAKRTKRSAGFVAAQAIQSLKDNSEAKDKMIQDAITEADKGVFISEEVMTKWVMSWDSENELPEPKPDIFPNKSK